MSEQATVVTPEPQGEPEADKPLGENGEKALRAERETRKALEKQLADAQKVIKDAEAASLSELERAQKEAAEAQTLLAQAQREALVSRVALEKAVPADLIQFLTGADEEAVAAQADLLVERLNKAPASPKPDPSQGGKGTPGQQFKGTGTQLMADAFDATYNV